MTTNIAELRRPRTSRLVLAILAGAVATLPARAQGVHDFSVNGLSFQLSADGRVWSLVDSVSGVQRITALPQYRKFLCVVVNAGVQIDPTSFSRSGNQIAYTFGTLNPSPVVTLGITQRTDYLVISIDNVANAQSIEELRFVNLFTSASVDGSMYRFLRYNDASGPRDLVISPLDPYTRTAVGPGSAGHYLWAMAYPSLASPTPISFVGRKVALLACGADDGSIKAALGQVESDQGVPLGFAARNHPATRRSTLFWMDFRDYQHAEVIQYSLAAGVGKIMLHPLMWGDQRHRYAPPAGWGSAAGLRAWVNQAHAAGLLVGAHTMPSIIPMDSTDYVLAGVDPRIRRDLTITLAVDLSASQSAGIIQTTVPPTGWPTASGQRILAIDQEIIEYTGLSLSPPYGFVGPFVRARNQSGAGGLGPQSHTGGATIGRLRVTDQYAYYQWDIASGGIEQWTRDIAAAVDAAGFDYVYVDHVEDIEDPPWYTAGYLQWTMYSALTNKPLWMESSGSTGNYSLPMIGVAGQIDYRWANGFRAEVNRNLGNTTSIWFRFDTRQLGWAQPANSMTEHTSPDDFEYLLAKSAAYDMPVVVQVWLDRVISWPNRDANLELMKRYEQVRLAGSIPIAQRQAAQRLDQDFMLFHDAGGAYQLEQTTRLPIASWSPDARGFISMRAINGQRYATIWPVAQAGGLEIVLDGLAPGDIAVENTSGAAVQVTDLGNGLLRVPLLERIYLRLIRVPDPMRLFSNATVRPFMAGGV
ncbi:MAG: hypothetical protein U1D55_10005 [Phycisphaerae bacterium]